MSSLFQSSKSSFYIYIYIYINMIIYLCGHTELQIFSYILRKSPLLKVLYYFYYIGLFTKLMPVELNTYTVYFTRNVIVNRNSAKLDERTFPPRRQKGIFAELPYRPVTSNETLRGLLKKKLKSSREDISVDRPNSLLNI